MILARRSDLALDKDDQGRFLPWLIAFMVFLAILATAGVMVLTALVHRWDRGVSGTLTVQIAPAETTAADRQRKRAALLLLRGAEGVIRSNPVTADDVRRLLEPWLGPTVGEVLPLPQLIDVKLAPDAGIDVSALRAKLAEAIPGVSVDDHRVWLDRLVRILETVKLLGFGVLGFILLATVGTVVFTTRTGLAIHREAIEVLHLIGARDGYIAAQFAARALTMGLKGGVLGLLTALPCLYGIGWLSSRMERGLIPKVDFGLPHWAGIVMAPVLVALVASATARVTVLRNLSRML